LEKQAQWLEQEYPSAAASLREGLEEMFTVNGLGLSSRIALEHLAAIRGDVPAILRGLKKNQSTYTS